MDIEHISISRAKLYEECPQHYKYHYHLKLQGEEPQPFYFIYGKIIHKIAECFVENNGEIPLMEIWHQIRKGELEIEPGVTAPKLPADYAKRLPIHLKSIKSLSDKIGTSGITEYEFRYDLELPNNKFVKGFIDRLIIKDEKAFIIDYKTTKKGKWRVNKHTVKYDPQLRMYARVVMKEFNIAPENIMAALYYLEDQEIVSSKYSLKSLLQIESDLLVLYNKIAEHHPDEVVGRVGFHCDRCPYKEICPFKRANSRVINWDGDLSNLP